MATAQKTNGKTAFEEKATPRRERQIYNRMKYRLTKRKNLYLRSIAAAKNPDKVKILQAKIAGLDYALTELDAV